MKWCVVYSSHPGMQRQRWCVFTFKLSCTPTSLPLLSISSQPWQLTVASRIAEESKYLDRTWTVRKAKSPWLNYGSVHSNHKNYIFLTLPCFWFWLYLFRFSDFSHHHNTMEVKEYNLVCGAHSSENLDSKNSTAVSLSRNDAPVSLDNPQTSLCIFFWHDIYAWIKKRTEIGKTKHY